MNFLNGQALLRENPRRFQAILRENPTSGTQDPCELHECKASAAKELNAEKN